MKCICGYEKIGSGYKNIPEQTILYKTGVRAGQVKEIKPASKIYVEDLDPENPWFIPILVEGKLEFSVKSDDFYFPYTDVKLFACPKCETVKMVR